MRRGDRRGRALRIEYPVRDFPQENHESTTVSEERSPRLPRAHHRGDGLRPHRPLRPHPARRHRLRRHRRARRGRRRRHLAATASPPSAISGRAKGDTEIDAAGLAVAPGFINMLSWATESLIDDGRSQSDIRQGVTLEVFGEGWSMGPLNDAMKKEQRSSSRATSSYDIDLDHARRVPRAPGARASRPTSPRSSARPPCASTSSATPTARRRRRSSSACGRWCARRWRKARSASARR